MVPLLLHYSRKAHARRRKTLTSATHSHALRACFQTAACISWSLQSAIFSIQSPERHVRQMAVPVRVGLCVGWKRDPCMEWMCSAVPRLVCRCVVVWRWP